MPKPSRAAYPCQRAAFPLASAFVLWLSALLAALVAGPRVRQWLQQARYGRMLPILLVAACTWLALVIYSPTPPSYADTMFPHDPIGIAKGAIPGRVVWVHDPDATDWAGTNLDGDDIGDGFWWQPEHTDQAAVDTMLSAAIRGLTAQPTDALAWNALFHHLNEQQNHPNQGYQPGQQITIKINLVTACRVHQNIDENGNQLTHLGWVNTSPQVIVAILRQLVHVVGVAEQDIAVGDPSAYFPNHYWNYCHPEFPNVRYLACTGEWGRHGVQSSAGHPNETPAHWSTPDAADAAQNVDRPSRPL